MKSAIAGAVLALAALASTRTATAQPYDPDTVIGITPNGVKVTYAQEVQLAAHFADDVRQAGGCTPYLQNQLGPDGKLTDGSILPFGLDPLISACNDGLAEH